LERIRWIREVGARLKINTVVTALNCHENLSDFIRTARPIRWKILQMTPVTGQNDQNIKSLQITRAEFETFVERHAWLAESGIIVISEPVDTIRGSYAMISPDGRFFDSSSGQHKYSGLIKEIGVLKAFQQVTFDALKYDDRNGNYNPYTGESILTTSA
jgi:radical S-adenosyl methionine domain-containing protein 2